MPRPKSVPDATVHHAIAALYRRGGDNVGPELSVGRAWNVAVYRTVQLVRIGDGRDSEFAVIVLFGGARLDLRYPPLRFDTLLEAQKAALERAREASGGFPVEIPIGARGSIDFARAGAVLCFEALA